MDIQEPYMVRCLQLAEMGMGNVAPNPMVGAVLVYEGRVIGEGYHMQFGGPHAEVNCINSVKETDRAFIQHSTLYVSLEPCNHYGKTPPCTGLIIQSRIPKVVIACADPFEKVNGSGIKKLMDAGIEVFTGVLEKEAMDLNKRFFTFHKLQRPYIILKWAQSSNAMIAGKENQRVKISNELTDKLVHKWRSEEAAIMVGTNTVLSDNPSLTTRLWKGKNPVRIFIDKKLQIDSTHHILDHSVPTIILNGIITKSDGNNQYCRIDPEEDFLKQLSELLYKQGLLSLIVEGGTRLIETFIAEGLWDESRVITNTGLEIKDGIAAPRLKNCFLYRKEHIGEDVIAYNLKQS